MEQKRDTVGLAILIMVIAIALLSIGLAFWRISTILTW